jgi:2-hydroxy-6-oxonona-2,4-dienedioate hydrolase
MTRILFLPGAGASPDFWKPVAERLPADWPRHHFGWPGLGSQPADPSIKSIDDLMRLVLTEMSEPVDLVAQSMGGIVATRLAIAHPRLVRRLVLTVTSGGVDMASFGASDAWRADYRKAHPGAWITEAPAAALVPVERITAPTLLIWGDIDPISPVAVGKHLEQRIPGARLHVVAGGDHDVAQTHAKEVAALIAAFLR